MLLYVMESDSDPSLDIDTAMLDNVLSSSVLGGSPVKPGASGGGGGSSTTSSFV